jgi:high-affinity iron transporter
MFLDSIGLGKAFLIVAGVLSTGLTASSRQSSSRTFTTPPVPRAEWSGAVVSAMTDGAELYRKYCVACHGAEGHGDGPAASGFDPPPTDLTDAERLQQLTDERMLEVLSGGSGTMPGFGSMLTREELRAVADYTRTLSGVEVTE